MADPEGTLTAAQHEILNVIWETKKTGATVAEIWQAISAVREVARTTVLNQVDRLEKRGWLKRYKHNDGFRYVATRTREQASSHLAGEFVDSYFGGSAAKLMMSLLGSQKLDPTEVAKLKKLLDQQTVDRKTQK